MNHIDKNHIHTYDSDGNITCCNLENKINASTKDAGLFNRLHHDTHEHDHDHDHDHDHTHHHDLSYFHLFRPALLSLFLLITALIFDHWLTPSWFTGWVRILWYGAAYIPVGLPVLRQAFKSILQSAFFSEFFLMGIATIGAFAIGEYAEGVAVMLFYSVGEVFQSMAVSKAKLNIKKLLDQRPDEVTVIRDDQTITIQAWSSKIGDIIQLKPGEKLGLDGILLSERASFNTAALTGESLPADKLKGDPVLAGMINLNKVTQVEVTTPYSDSKLSRILDLVQNATAQKAPTELFIRKFAKIYTPIVVLLAAAICVLPYFFVREYFFQEWFYRALVFLVISCPCALVISIPLGYFGGLGAASQNGILLKGSNFLDVLAKIQHVVMDKTGTLTEGVFKVKEVIFKSHIDQNEILQWVNALESYSTHPVASAIQQYVGKPDRKLVLTDVEELDGLGMKANINGKLLLAGNIKLLEMFSVNHDIAHSDLNQTIIAIAHDHQFAGYLTISDNIRIDAKQSVEWLHHAGIKTTVLSGDKQSVVNHVAENLGIVNAFGELLPEDKMDHLKKIKQGNVSVAFVGDGINDAPVVALSDVGIAMGGLGSDATIETADVVIQDDKPGKIPVAIMIGKQTKRIVWQNIILAFAVKAAVLILGAWGFATMWEAVFADVGVALLAIFNAIRLQYMKFGLDS